MDHECIHTYVETESIGRQTIYLSKNQSSLTNTFSIDLWLGANANLEMQKIQVPIQKPPEVIYFHWHFYNDVNVT